MIYALYIEQKITIFALYTKHKYKNQINNLTMENELQVIGTKEVEERIIELRGQKILLDRDVAELYKTETRDINKAVRNNPEKFPSGYFFTLKRISAFMYMDLFRPVFGDFGGSLAWAIFFVVLNWIPGYFLYKKKIYIKL